jgi:SAM-dependent methyltransferase
VSGSTKPPASCSSGAARGSGTARGSGDGPARAAPKVRTPALALRTDIAPAVTAASDERLDELVDRMAAEVVLRHATGRRVLDLGRGAPRVSEQVATRAASHMVVDAVDLGRGAKVALPLPDASFDLVYCLRTLPHLGHDAESSEQAAASLLGEVARLLAPTGVALVWIDNPLSLWGALHGLRRPAKALERGPLVIDSARGLTRFDTLPRLLRMLPPSLSMTRLHGMRVVTLVPHVLAIPLVGRVLTGIEWWARDRALVRRLAAHLLVELRRTSPFGPRDQSEQDGGRGFA